MVVYLPVEFLEPLRALLAQQPWQGNDPIAPLVNLVLDGGPNAIVRYVVPSVEAESFLVGGREGTVPVQRFAREDGIEFSVSRLS